MFKFIRYFFILFVATTVVPLVSLFVWTNYQIGKMESYGAQNMIEIGTKQAEVAIHQYLKTNEGLILEKIYNLPDSKITESGLKQTFKDSKVKFIYGKNISKISSEYKSIKNPETLKSEIYLLYKIPIKKSNIKGIELFQKADFTKLDIRGPFVAEVYASNKINRENFVSVARVPLILDASKFKPPMPKGILKPPMHHPPEMDLGIPKNKVIKYDTVNILDSKGQIIATLLLKAGMRPEKVLTFPITKDIFGIIILFAGFVLTLALAFFIDKNFVRPLAILAEASKEVQQGNLSAFIYTDTKQEQIQNTFNNFNEMLKGIKEKEDLRDSYIASLTHDLRTPIIAQERALALISKKFEQLGLQEEYDLSKSVEKNSIHLLRIVNLILESYQFSKQKIKLEYSDINLKELIEDCFDKVRPISDDKNISLLNNVPDNLDLNVDKINLERVFINLIFNAVENIGENKKIEIRAEKMNNIIKIIIEDNGFGISPSEINHIFERYYTGKSPNRKLGSGLGLDVCKKLIQMHGGNIAVDSEVDKYTRFTVEIPA